MAAHLLHGIQPGPQIFVTHPETAYAILASLFVGVVGMCLIGYFWIRLVVKVLTFPQPIIMAIVVLFCVVGSYAERNSFAHVGMILLVGIIGYLFEKYGFPIAPMVLGSILGPLAETSYPRSMIRYDNDWTIFFSRPISCTLLVMAMIAFAFPLLSRLRRQRAREQPAFSK